MMKSWIKESHIPDIEEMMESIETEADEETRTILNVHVFHLLQTASKHTIDLDVGIPARGWHGEAYRGHIFWDELFIFPFLTLHMPDLTKALLQYRYRRLGAAIRAAQAEGYVPAEFIFPVEKERPDVLLPTLGGQTGLNLAMDLDREGVLEKFLYENAQRVFFARFEQQG